MQPNLRAGRGNGRHADQTLLANFVITPMGFLGATFFPLSHLPSWGQMLLELLPLTHAAHAVRAAAFQKPARLIDFVVLIEVGGICFLFAILSVNRAKA